MQPLAKLETDAFLKAHDLPADTRVWDQAKKDAWLAEFYAKIDHRCSDYDKFWFMTLFYGGEQSLDLFSACPIGDSGRIAGVCGVFVM
jgi:hypothetical protein